MRHSSIGSGLRQGLPSGRASRGPDGLPRKRGAEGSPAWAGTAPRAHDDVTHAPAIVVIDLHALHLAAGIAGSVKSRAGVESGCAKSHASPPPVEGGSTTAQGAAVPA